MSENDSGYEPTKFAALHPILLEAQRVGALSGAPIELIISHALWFARAISDNAKSVVDLGSGAGVPGLIVALDRPDLELILVDRRSGRTDSLTRAVSALNLSARVKVVCAEIDALARDSNYAHRFDAAISRGLGPPNETLKLSTLLVKPGGVIVISEPPLSTQSRWVAKHVSDLGLEGPERVGAVAMFHVKQSD